MGAWAIFAAPLIMGNDVRNLTASQRSILLNKDVIAISQDPLGASWHPPLCSALHSGINLTEAWPCRSLRYVEHSRWLQACRAVW